MTRVLLLDEDASFAALIDLVTKRLGHELHVVASKQAALRALAGAAATGADLQGAPPYAVIILDAAFADGGEAEIAEALSALKPRAKMLLLRSAYKPAALTAGLGDLATDRVLHKPIDVVGLERELAELTGASMGELNAADTLAADTLRQNYRKPLAADLHTLERASMDTRVKSGVEAVLGRLAGTAGSYGYLSLSAQARVAIHARRGVNEQGADLHADFDIDLDQPEHDHDESAAALEELCWVLRAALESPAPPLARAATRLGVLQWPTSALVVSARPDIVSQVGLELAAHGIDLRFAPTVDDALELAEHYQPDLIVADARLVESSADDFPIDEELRAGFARAMPMVLLGVPDDAAERVRAANAGTTVFATEGEEGAVLAAAQVLAPESYLGTSMIVVDDDPDITDLAEALLEPFGVQVHVAHEPATLFAILQRERPALILLDLQLPSYGGHELCRTLKAEPRFRDISIVYLTADDRPQTKVLAYQNGADDFLSKPVVPQELVAKVLSKLRHQQLAFQLHMRDRLTGALSRTGIEQQAAALLARRERPPGCGLMLAHVEGLHGIRKEAGLLTAERALRETGQALSDAFLGRDAVGRFGELESDGAHFMVLVHGGAPMAFSSSFERIKRHLAEHPVFGPEGYFRQLSISAGATPLNDRDALPLVLERAQKALQKARTTGRTLVVG